VTEPTDPVAARLSHIEFLTAEEIGEDAVPDIAALFGLGETWTQDAALICVSVPTPGGDMIRRTYIATDVPWARMLDSADGPIDMTDAAWAQMPLVRDGWPTDWMGDSDA
jgi:hypothetical protein